MIFVLSHPTPERHKKALKPVPSRHCRLEYFTKSWNMSLVTCPSKLYSSLLHDFSIIRFSLMCFPVCRIVSCHMHIVMGDCWKLLTKTGRRTSYLTTVCRWTALTWKHSSAFTQITRDHRERKILLSNRVEIHWFKYSQQSSWQMPVRSFRTESLFGEWPRSTSFHSCCLGLTLVPRLLR